MTIKNINISFAVDAEECPMAVVHDKVTYELLSVFSGPDAATLYHNLTKRDMRHDYNELRAIPTSEEGSTEHS